LRKASREEEARKNKPSSTITSLNQALDLKEGEKMSLHTLVFLLFNQGN